MTETPWVDKVMAMRRAFDESFTSLPLPEGQPQADVVAIRVEGRPYALPLADLRAIVADRRLVALPSAAPDFLGLAGWRGTLVPVFDLAALLGHGRSRAAPRWLAVCRAGTGTVGLAVDAYEGIFRVPTSALHAAQAASAEAGAAPGVVPHADGHRPLVPLPAIIAKLGTRHRRP